VFSHEPFAGADFFPISNVSTELAGVDYSEDFTAYEIFESL